MKKNLWIALSLIAVVALAVVAVKQTGKSPN